MQNKLPRFDDPRSLDLIAEQALVRMSIAGRLHRRDVGKLPSHVIRSVARELLDHTASRASIHRRLCAEHAGEIRKAIGRPLTDDAVQRFAHVFQVYAGELHRELIAAVVAPARRVKRSDR